MKLLIASFLALAVLASATINPSEKGSDPSKRKKEKYGTVIGIDLGTTYSCVGVFKNGKVEIISNDQGNRITPSYVAFTSEGKRLIGDSAKNQLTSNPENTIFDVKRLIGRAWSDPSVQHDIEMWPFKVIKKGDKPYVEVKIGNDIKQFAPEEISAMVLGYMKQVAEAYLGKEVKHAVVTVPAYFNDGQRQATKLAGTIAGLNVVRIINEPTAAALAYGLDKRDVDRNILVYDLGGGTFDVTLLTIEHGTFEVLATSGDTHLGGEDFDRRVMDHFLDMYKQKTGKDARTNKKSVQKLRREVEKAKRMLSTQHQARVEVENFFKNKDFSEVLTRAKFEELNKDLFLSTLKPLKQVLEDAGMEIEDIEEVVLAGGSTRIPKIQQLLKDFFKGKEPSRGINPDEAIAFGAAVQGNALSGEDDAYSLVLVDVNPLTLGFAVRGIYMNKVIPRNTAIPTKRSTSVTTLYDYQTVINFEVYEGERQMVEDNHHLGGFKLHGIPPELRDVPSVEVTFEIDANGILHVSAVDRATGNKNGVTITNDRSRVNQEDVERMVQDAEIFAEEDRLAKELMEAHNQLDHYLYRLKSVINDDGAQMSPSDKDLFNKAVDVLMKLSEKRNDLSVDELQEIMAKVEALARKYGVNLNQQTGHQRPPEDNYDSYSSPGGGETDGDDGGEEEQLDQDEGNDEEDSQNIKDEL